MISANEANTISRANGFTMKTIHEAALKQEEEISNIIKKIAGKGYYSYFYPLYKGEMYSEVYEKLEEEGFRLTDVFTYDRHGNRRECLGVNIEWFIAEFIAGE